MSRRSSPPRLTIKVPAISGPTQEIQRGALKQKATAVPRIRVGNSSGSQIGPRPISRREEAEDRDCDEQRPDRLSPHIDNWRQDQAHRIPDHRRGLAADRIGTEAKADEPDYGNSSAEEPRHRGIIGRRQTRLGGDRADMVGTKVATPQNPKVTDSIIRNAGKSRLRAPGSRKAALVSMPGPFPFCVSTPSVCTSGTFNTAGKYTLALQRGNTPIDSRWRSGLEEDIDAAVIDRGIARPGLSDRLLPDHRPLDAVRLELVRHDRAARLGEIFVRFSRPSGACPRLNDDLVGSRFAGALCRIGDDGLCFVGEESTEFVEIDKKARATLIGGARCHLSTRSGGDYEHHQDRHQTPIPPKCTRHCVAPL